MDIMGMVVKNNVSVNLDHVIHFLENVYLVDVWMDTRVTLVVTVSILSGKTVIY